MSITKSVDALSQRVSSGHYFLWLLLGGTFLAAYLPVMIELVNAWYGSDDYSHGFLIVPLVLFISWQKRRSLSGVPISGSWVGLPVAFLSLLAYLFARVGEILTLASLSMIGCSAGMILFLFGFHVLRLFFFHCYSCCV